MVASLATSRSSTTAASSSVPYERARAHARHTHQRSTPQSLQLHSSRTVKSLHFMPCLHVYISTIGCHFLLLYCVLMYDTFERQSCAAALAPYRRDQSLTEDLTLCSIHDARTVTTETCAFDRFIKYCQSSNNSYEKYMIQYKTIEA